ncbi:MAG: hypothetical protein GY845_01000 [Planctomycetes bacterium]|nr:hypothetical protein [Planctomycetota bacterium]
MKHKRDVSKSKWAVIITAIAIITIVVSQSGRADITATSIHEKYWFGSGYGGNYLNTSLSVYVDPSITNWIAWHDQTTPDLIGGVEYVGDNSWLGTDDYFYLTITKSGGGSSGAILMDYNSSMGTASGPQAVMYGTAADAPNVHRSDLYGVHKYFDEAGPFTSFFDAQGAGNYTFNFAFWDGYSGSYGIPDMYLLVDAAVVPVPGAVLLGMLGLGVAGLKLRKFA